MCAVFHGLSIILLATCRWKGGRTTKLEGSDHVPVYVVLSGLPPLPVHNTPPLAVRYIPEVRGWQQTIGEKTVKCISQKKPTLYDLTPE